MTRRDPFSILIAALPSSPDDDALRPLARALAQHAATRAATSAARHPSPTKSIVKRIERRLADRSVEIKRAVLRLAQDELETAPVAAPPMSVSPDFEPLAAAAARRGISAGVLLLQLTWPQHRRRMGWPECRDGRRDWWFPVGAVALERATLAAEPYHLLPEHCRRVEDVDMSRPPTDGAP
jgi:hypothetical protein